MTVSTTNRRAGPFVGDGVTTVFPFTFTAFEDGDLYVVRADDTTMDEEVLALTTDYTVDLNADQDISPGGSVTLLAPLATGTVLALTTAVPETQEVVVTNNGGFFASIFNRVFDRLTVLVQQLKERQSRSLVAPITSGVTNLNLSVVPNGVLAWSADGTELSSITLPDLSLLLALPDQAGANGKVLQSNGTVAAWQAIVNSLTAAGGLLSVNAATGAVTITLTKASATEIRALTNDAKVITPLGLGAACDFVALTYAAAQQWDLAAAPNAKVTLTGNAAFAAPTNIKPGVTYMVATTQDATGSRLVTWDAAAYDFRNSSAPAASTGAGKTDYWYFHGNVAGDKLVFVGQGKSA